MLQEALIGIVWDKRETAPHWLIELLIFCTYICLLYIVPYILNAVIYYDSHKSHARGLQLVFSSSQFVLASQEGQTEYGTYHSHDKQSWQFSLSYS